MWPNRPMLKLRVIPCLDVKDGRVVKGVNFMALRDAGDPVELAAFYDEGFVANGPPKDVTLDGAGVGGSINVWRASTFEFSYGHGFARAPNSRSPDRIEGRLVLAL